MFVGNNPYVTHASVGVTETDYYIDRAGSALNNTSATSIAGWVAGNAAVFESSTEQARTGTTSIKIASGVESTSQFKYFDVSSGLSGQTGDIVNGDNCTITGWVYAPSGATVSVNVTGTDLGNTPITFTPDTWSQFTFTMTGNSTGVNLYLYTNSASYTYFDDIRLYKTE